MKRTLNTIALVLLVGTGAFAQATAPTVDQILDKYIEAIGGRAAFDRLTSRVMIGSFEVAARGLTVPLEVYAKPPDIRAEIMGFGEASQGFNGDVGWSMNVNDNGLRELTGQPLTRFKRQSLFNREVKIREQYGQLATAGKARIGERETYVLEGAVADAGTEKLFFDVQTGLLVRQTVGALEISFEDYREIDGVKLPYTIRRKVPNAGVISSIFREVKHNVPIDESKFKVPNP
jgi:zinc protease